MSCIDWQALAGILTTPRDVLQIPLVSDFFKVTSTFAFIAGAEIGDKSQIVCMTLAARHRRHGWAVFAGSSLALVLLNAIAVMTGAWLLAWIPHDAIAISVILLFLFYGVKSWMNVHEEEDTAKLSLKSRSVFISSFMMLFMAELGDKTQLTVAALSTEFSPWIAWAGASLALMFTTAMAVALGFRLLKRLSPIWIHRAGGTLFLAFALSLSLKLLSEHQWL